MFSVCEHPPTLNLMDQDARYLQIQNDEPPVTQQPEKTPCNLCEIETLCCRQGSWR